MIAVSKTGPFLVLSASPVSTCASSGNTTTACASAVRRVTALSPTSTIVGRSFWSTCVSIGRPSRSLHAPASAAHPVHLDAPALAGFAQLGAQLAVAVGPRSPDVLQEPDELRVARSRAKRPAQVGAARREEARIELALGRQP